MSGKHDRMVEDLNYLNNTIDEVYEFILLEYGINVNPEGGEVVNKTALPIFKKVCNGSSIVKQLIDEM